MHSVTKHLARPAIASPLPTQRGRLPGLYPGLDFTLNPQARRYARPNRVRLSYGLHVRLRLLSTPPRGDAVTFGYRERASPGEGTFTPQIAPAPRRTDSRFRRNDEFCGIPTFYEIINLAEAQRSSIKNVMEKLCAPCGPCERSWELPRQEVAAAGLGKGLPVQQGVFLEVERPPDDLLDHVAGVAGAERLLVLLADHPDQLVRQGRVVIKFVLQADPPEDFAELFGGRRSPP